MAAAASAKRGLVALTEFDVYDDKGEPAENVAVAQDALGGAATLASSVAEALSEAQVAINSQGYGRG